MKKLLNKLSGYTLYIIISLVLITFAGFFLLLYQNIQNQQKINLFYENIKEIQDEQELIKNKLPDQLLKDHWKVIENIQLRSQLEELETKIEAFQNTEENSQMEDMNEIFFLYEDYGKKLVRNENLDLEFHDSAYDINTWGDLLLDQNYIELKPLISDKIAILDNSYDEYLASLPKTSGSSGEGYSYTTVNTEKGSFGIYLLKFPKSSVTIKTVAAINDDCKDDCATKSLDQYVNENNAYAGMAGSYTCPADYDWCDDKTWSFDFALYDSNDKKWLNKDALSWNETGMITFSGQNADFYEKTSDFDGDHVTAGISNFPSLLNDGNIVVDSGDTDSYQEIKGVRGAIGFDNDNVYLAYVSGASVIDAAYALRALGVQDALNLDGGGTSAMYVNGGYVVGPGRPLANAVLIIR